MNSVAEKSRDYSLIFEPITIGNVEIKNRIAMAPMNMNYTGPNHQVSDQQMAYYAARAKGGTGLIITEAVLASDHPTAHTYKKYNNASLCNELYVPRMSELVEHVHAFGAKIFVQLGLGPGRQGTSEAGAIQPVSASPIPYATYPENLVNGMDPLALVRACGYQALSADGGCGGIDQLCQQNSRDSHEWGDPKRNYRGRNPNPGARPRSVSQTCQAMWV